MTDLPPQRPPTPTPEDEAVAKMVETLLWLRPDMPRADAEEHVADLFDAVNETTPEVPPCTHPNPRVETDHETWVSRRVCDDCGMTRPV